MDSELDIELLSTLDYTPLLSPLATSNHGNSHQHQQGGPQQQQTSVLSPLSSPALPFKHPQKRRESSLSTQYSNKRSKTPLTTPLMPANLNTSNIFEFLPDLDLQLPPPPNIDTSYKKHSNVLINPNRLKSNHSSPVILPSSNPMALQSPSLTPLARETTNNSSSNLSFTSQHHTANMSPINTSSTSNNVTSTSNSTTSNNTSSNSATATVGTVGTSILTRQNSKISLSSSLNSGGDKKMTHKLAEQGRRNRMNVAIQDLEKLIPEIYKREISVPSKATTVELGCTYIRELENEIQRLKNSSSTS